MSISKKIRFEIFKRDGFCCAYCGQSPPTVILEVDHIKPKSKGGKNDINNYITACFDCNRGKRDIELDKIAPQIKDNLEVLKQKEEQIKEYRKFVQGIERRLKRDINDVAKIYSDFFEGWELSENFKEVSLRKFLNSLPKHEVEDAMRRAVSKIRYNSSQAIKYFCGMCWNKIKNEGQG